jgi:ribose transport system permease protein
MDEEQTGDTDYESHVSLSDATTGKMASRLRFLNVFFNYRELSLLLIVIALGILLSIFTENFSGQSNLFNVARQVSLIIVVALGATLVLISGGIDLSVGSVLGLAGIVTSLASVSGIPVVIAILLGLATGVACGLINGLLIAKAKINPFIVTLGMMSVARGIALVVTKGYSITIESEFLLYLGQGYVGPVPVPVIIMILCVLAVDLYYRKHTFGSRVRAIGGNEEAARISGIKIDKNRIVIYALAAFLAAFAGIIMVGRLNVGQPSAGQGWELRAIAAAIVGGTSLSGGVGSIWGTVLGAILIGIIGNGMVLLGIPMEWEQVVTGTIIVAAVALDSLTRRRTRGTHG